MEQKRTSVSIDPKSETDLRKALIWYTEKGNAGIFRNGMYVAIRPGDEEADAHLPNLPALWNTQGDFRGSSGNRKMSDLIP
jgi:hypothetical protein